MVGGVVIRGQEQQWVEVKPGIFRKALRDDPATGAQCLLFRLGPGMTYPEHGHPSGEEFYVLEGSITVDETLLEQGDYYRTPPGERHFNHSNTGTTVLVITPPQRD
jgi:quercetin dioxygenase-like cupin family protein